MRNAKILGRYLQKAARITVAAAALAVIASCLHVPAPRKPPRVDLVSLLHHPVSRPVVLEFFFNTCVACRQNEADLEALAAALQGRADVYAVSIDCEIAEVESWKAKFHPSYPILDGCKGDLVDLLKIEGYPTTVVLDVNGDVVEKKLGLLSLLNADLIHWRFHTNGDAVKAAVERVEGH